VNFDANSLVASLIIGCVGMALFIYGKRQSRTPHMAGGVLLMAYPYFVSDVLLMSGIAVLLVGGLWLAVRLGA
jgi:hypothetical protein